MANSADPSHLIWVYTVFKERIYLDSAWQRLNCTFVNYEEMFLYSPLSEWQYSADCDQTTPNIAVSSRSTSFVQEIVPEYLV